MYTLNLKRVLSKRTSDDKIKTQIQYIIDRGLAGARGKTWRSSFELFEPLNLNGQWVFTAQLNFVKERGEKNGEAEYRQWEDIKAMIQQSGANTKFQQFPWKLVDAPVEQTEAPVETANPEITPESFENTVSDLNNILTKIIGIREIQEFGPAKKWDDLHVPDELLGEDSDRYLSEHPAWKNLYGLNPQTRILLSNIKRAQETGGKSRNHAVLFGHAGCGKTTTMFSLEQMFGAGSVLKLDATSTTKAGLEKLFFSDLKEIPPLVFMEEAEKADPEALKIWLGALDDRGEIRKINFKVNQLRSLEIVFICSVNNKTAFDRMMGSDGTEPGALSSRCVSQIYYPRPSVGILQQILEKEIRDKGGKQEWIVPAIQLSQQLNISDPRIVKSYLAGGDRLLNGSYQKDWIAMIRAQEAFNKG